MEVAIMRGTVIRQRTIISKGVMVARGRVLTAVRAVGQDSLYKEEPAAFYLRSMTFTDASQLHHMTLLPILRTYPKLLRSFCLRTIQGVFRCIVSTCSHDVFSWRWYVVLSRLRLTRGSLFVLRLPLGLSIVQRGGLARLRRGSPTQRLCTGSNMENDTRHTCGIQGSVQLRSWTQGIRPTGCSTTWGNCRNT